MPSDNTSELNPTAQLKLKRDRQVADGLFLIQMISAVGFIGTQVILMRTTIEGISFTWLAFWGVFLLINLSLSCRAHQLRPSRITLQTVITYGTWTLILALCIAIYIWRESTIWTPVDTWTAGLALGGILLTLVIGHLNKLPISDPLVRGYLAVFFKAVPQLALSYHILMVGGAGMSTFAIVSGHITISSRLGQVLMSLREAGWDRNRRGSAISEFANEGTWIIVTIAWLIVL